MTTTTLSTDKNTSTSHIDIRLEFVRVVSHLANGINLPTTQVVNKGPWTTHEASECHTQSIQSWLLVKDLEEILHLQLSVLGKIGTVYRVLSLRPAEHCPQRPRPKVPSDLLQTKSNINYMHGRRQPVTSHTIKLVKYVSSS